MAEVEQPKPKTKQRRVGTRQDVFDGTCERTAGGLRREDLIINERTGKICTERELARGKKMSAFMRNKDAPIPEDDD